MAEKGGFQGYVALGDTIKFPIQARNTSDVPINADAAPRRFVYGPTGSLVTAAEGQSSQQHTGTVTAATAASPIVLTSAAHGLQTGARIYLSGITGLTGASDGYYTVTRVSADTFSLDGTTGGGAWVSGGTWNVAGLYQHSIVASSGNGFSQGKTYYVHSVWAISSAARAQDDSFTVV